MTVKSIPLKLTPEIGFIKSFVLITNKKALSLSIDLNGHYGNKKAVSSVCTRNWKKTQHSLREALKSKGVSEDDINLTMDILDNNSDIILGNIHEDDTGTAGSTGFGSFGDDDGEEESQATIALGLIEEYITDKFVDKFETPFVTVKINNHVETLPVKRNKFKKLICKLFYESEDKPIRADALTSACNVIEAQALFSDKVKGLDLRVSDGRVDINEDGVTERSNNSKGTTVIHYDLTNKKHQVIKVDINGWSVEDPDKVPAMFYRRQGQTPQVIPSREYPSDIIDQFMNLINVQDDDMRLLLKCYIIALFIPGITRVILMLYGEKGSAKTALMELIKKLVDPNSALTLTFPRSIAEVVQQLAHNFISYYDNVSKVPDWLSDALCRAATGTGFSKRELYTDDDDIIYEYIRSTGLSGIHLPGTKPDLLDRSLMIKLIFIRKEKRRKYVETILAEFERIKPQILGYIFDILVKVLRVKAKGGIELETRSRMADWEEYAEIISQCMGNEPLKFIKAYEANIELQTDVVLEDRPVAKAMIKLMESQDEWGPSTTTELLAALEVEAINLKINTQKDKLWPKAASSLAYRLNEIKPSLREIGISIDEIKDSRTRLKTLKVCKTPSAPSAPSADEKPRSNETRTADGAASENNTTPSDKNPDSEHENQGANDADDANGDLHTSQDEGESRTKSGIYQIGDASSDLWACSYCKQQGDKGKMWIHHCWGPKT